MNSRGKGRDKRENLGMHKRHLRDESFDPDIIVYNTCFDTFLADKTKYRAKKKQSIGQKSNLRKGDFLLAQLCWKSVLVRKGGKQLIDCICLHRKPKAINADARLTFPCSSLW